MDLEVTIGEGLAQRIEMIQFMVLDLESQFNAILGTPPQTLLDSVSSVPHQQVKFLTSSEVGCIQSNPHTFYENTMNE